MSAVPLRDDPRLAHVLRSVRLKPNGRAEIRHGGETVSTDPLHPTPAADPTPSRRGWEVLQGWLYRRVFIHPLESAPPAPGSNDTLPTGSYVRRLDEANSSHEHWEPGFVITRLESQGAVIAERAGIALRLRSTEYHPALAEGLSPRVGTPVLVRRPRASLTLQQGVYYAFGETLQSREDAATSRLYLAGGGAEATVALFRHLVSALNAADIPFSLKTLLEGHERRRTDATVLYLPRRFEAAALETLEARPPAAQLGPVAPLFAFEARPGIGLGDEPGGGESFGLSRCRLLALALLDAKEAGRDDEHSVLAALESRYREAGLDPGQPHRGRPRRPTGTSVQHPLDARPHRAPEWRSDTVLERLVERGLVPSEGSANWRIEARTRRNDNFLVRPSRHDAPGVFVKALRVGGQESRQMFDREVAIYRHAAHQPDLARLLPTFLESEDEPAALFLEAPAAAGGARGAHPAGDLSADTATALGRQLAHLHRLGAEIWSPLEEHWRREAPGILTAHRGGPLLRWLGPVQRTLVNSWSRDAATVRALDHLRRSLTHQRLTHGDLKLDNILLLPKPPVALLVDWELADLGDPAWDGGCLLAAGLEPWILQGPEAALSLEQRLSSTPLDNRALPSLAAAWTEGLGAGARSTLLTRSVGHAGARLLQAALEHSHGRPTPHPRAPALLAVARSLLLRPEASGHQLRWLP